MYKKFLSIVTAITVFSASLSAMPLGIKAETTEEKLLDPVYYMDFTPSDGDFYDSPSDAAGVAKVPLENNPTDIISMPGDTTNYNGKIMSLNQTGRVKISCAENERYDAFSGYGASGAPDDYCLKSVDASSASGTPWIQVDFPETYGGTSDTYSNKYRFEIDWKWQAYKNSTTKKDAGTSTGTNLIRFYIGGQKLNLATKAGSDNSNDARGTGALYFECAAFDMKSKTTGETTAAADVEKVTKSAEALPASESGKWQHITIDFDFGAGTIYALIEGDTEIREISTTVPSKHLASFANGVSSVGLLASTTGERRINYFDNIKISPIIPLPDEDKLARAMETPYVFGDIKGSNSDASEVTEDLSLPQANNGVNVTWSVSPASAAQFIDLSTGEITRPTSVQGNQTITLTPAYSIGECSGVGEPISNVVLIAAERTDMPLEPVYYMDFSPDSDGDFYDLPQGFSGRTKVAREEIPQDAVFFPDHTAFQNKSILNTSENTSVIKTNNRTVDAFAVFSKGDAANDVNTGATGAVDDYCIKMIDAGSSTSNVSITFPEAYGNPNNGNDFVKYRFEMDYKWQQYSNISTKNNTPPTGTSWLRFNFGENTINLYSKTNAESSDDNADASGGSALCFTGSAFGMTAANQKISADEGSEHKTAAMVPWADSGKWAHITVDFDFEDGTIDAKIETATATRVIKTNIPDGTATGEATFKSLFAEGLTGVTVMGTTGTNLRAIWADNIKISPMQTTKPTPSEKLNSANNPPTVFDDIKGINSAADNVTENLNLIAKKGAVDVLWQVSPTEAAKYVNTTSGVVTRPAYTIGSQAISLTPTYTVAGRTLTGDAINIVVAALPESNLEKVERIILTSPFVFNDICGQNTSGDAVSKDLSLPSSAETDVQVSWRVESADMAAFVDVTNGTVTRPLYTDEDKTIKLIPTYTLGTIVKDGYAIEFKVIRKTLDISEPEIQDAYAIDVSDLIGQGQSSANVTGNLTLPKSGTLNGSVISWSATPLIVDTESGVVTRPFGAAKMNVVLTATVTNGGNSTQRQFTITVVDSSYASGISQTGGGGGGVAYTGAPSYTGKTDNTPSVNTPAGSDNAVFSDISDVDWAKEYITMLYQRGVINGVGNGMFEPHRYVMREELVKMILLLFNIDTGEYTPSAFGDVSIGDWFEPYVSTAYGLNLVNGISPALFGAGNSVSRQDMAAMIVRCMEYKNISTEKSAESVSFDDESEISEYAIEAVKLLREAGILNGDDNNNFNPELFASRAEVAKVLGMIAKIME